MSQGLSVFLLIGSGFAVTGCPRDRCPNIPLPEESDATAQLSLPEKGTLDLDLIGGRLWLELWDSRPFVRDANTLICPVTHGNSSGSRLETVCEEGGMMITGSRTGTGETGRLRIDPKPLVVDEVEAEQEAVQIRVRKGPVQPTEE